MIKLDIGSGSTPIPDHLGVDPYVATNYSCPMWQLPWGDSSVDAIYSSHALEHIPQHMVIPTLTEWKRVIKPDCIITIRVPNLEWCVRRWLQTKSTGWDMAIIYGNQKHDGEYHRTGFTTGIMIRYLVQVGLVLIKQEVLWTHEQETLSFEVTK